MIRYAKIRRGLDLVQADASAMPFGKGSYRTIIYATGVVDFMSDEEEIRLILNEAKQSRITRERFLSLSTDSALSRRIL